ncbi:MAG: MaoC/PaaZ C-terminal domain-containing protein [Woeseiaceae bacterium]|nr:MaoC/PaaZ C-terminal domain-containing protein [Woeseiaceae bacterium]
MIEPVRYFEDLEVGETHVSEPRTVTEDEIVEFASRYDPQYFHMDAEAAESHPQFGEVVASGIHILALWRQLDHEITGDIRWICGIAWRELRWHKPLRAGDAVRARAELVDKRRSSKNPGRGVVDYRYSLLNQDDEEIFWCLSLNYVERTPDE